MHPDILILVVGVFITFMAVWATVVYGLVVVQRRRRLVASEASEMSGPSAGGSNAVGA